MAEDFISVSRIRGSASVQAASCPGFHKFAALFQGIAPPVSLFGFVTNNMRHSRLCDFAREVRDIARPIVEAGAKAMDGDGRLDLHPAQNHSMAILEAG